MTSKGKISEQARRIIIGGNPTADAEVTLEEISLYVSQAFGSIVSRIYFENRSTGEGYINGDFIYPFDDIEVDFDYKKKLYYIIMPTPSVALPHDLGIYYVGYQEDQDNGFIRVPNGFMSLYKGLKSRSLQGNGAYFVESNRIYFPNMVTNDALSKVLLKLVAPLGSLELDEDVNIPENIQGEIVNVAVQLYRQQQQAPKDIINDKIK